MRRQARACCGQSPVRGHPPACAGPENGVRQQPPVGTPQGGEPVHVGAGRPVHAAACQCTGCRSTHRYARAFRGACQSILARCAQVLVQVPFPSSVHAKGTVVHRRATTVCSQLQRVLGEQNPFPNGPPICPSCGDSNTKFHWAEDLGGSSRCLASILVSSQATGVPATPASCRARAGRRDFSEGVLLELSKCIFHIGGHTYHATRPLNRLVCALN
jgi:hypothetical protein